MSRKRGAGRKEAGWVGTALREQSHSERRIQGARKGSMQHASAAPGGSCSLGGPARGVTCQPAGERGLQGLADQAAVGNLMVGLLQQRTADSASLHRQRTAEDRFTCRALQTK